MSMPIAGMQAVRARDGTGLPAQRAVWPPRPALTRRSAAMGAARG